MTASGNQIYFFYLFSIQQKTKIEKQNKPQSNCTGEYLEDLTIETDSFCRTQAQVRKHIIILRYIIQKVYWFP